MVKQRIDYIDTAKGLLILSVVLGHIFLDGPVNQFIYAFHMPAFFIITGMMLNYASSLDKPMLAFFKSRIRTLIVPLLFFEVIGVLTDIIRYGITLNLFGYAYNTISGNFNTGPNWFLFATFVSELLFYLLHKLLRKQYPIIITAILISALMIRYRGMFPNAGQTGIAFLFILLGFYGRRLFEADRKETMILSLAGLLLITAINGSVDIGLWRFGFVPFFAIGAVVGTILVLSASKRISSPLLGFFGRNSLIVMGTHQAILLPIRRFANLLIFPAHIGVLVFIGSIALEIPIIRFLNHYVPFLVGKKRS